MLDSSISNRNTKLNQYLCFALPKYFEIDSSHGSLADGNSCRHAIEHVWFLFNAFMRCRIRQAWQGQGKCSGHATGQISIHLQAWYLCVRRRPTSPSSLDLRKKGIPCNQYFISSRTSRVQLFFSSDRSPKNGMS